MRIPIALRIGVLVTIPVIAVAAVVGWLAYRESIVVLIEHEEVDLRDETRLRCDWIQSQIAMLRHDVLYLASTPPVSGIVRARQNASNAGQTPSSAERVDPQSRKTELALREELADLLQEACYYKSHTSQEQRGNRKPYFQVRFIGKDGHEIVRIQRKPGTDVFDTDYESDDVDKSHEPYYLAVKDMAARSADGASPMQTEMDRRRIYLSRVELNVENGKKQPDQPVLRAAAPVFDSGNEFAGFVIVNMDFQQIVRELSGSPRHLVYLTDDDGNFLIHPNKTMQFVWDDKAKQQALGKSDCRIQDQPGFAALADYYSRDYQDKCVPTSGGFERRALECQGALFANTQHPFPPPGTVFDDHFTLAVLQRSSRMTDANWKQVAEKLQAFRLSEGLRAPPVDVAVQRPEFPISMTSRDSLEQVLSELENDSSIKPAFNASHNVKYVVDCMSFAGAFSRIYIDPAVPQRYLALAMAFSYEEQDAELGATKWLVFWKVFGLIMLVGTVTLVLSQVFARRVSKITRAAEKMASGDFDVSLPPETNDELGELVRGFRRMSLEVHARDAEVRRKNDELEQFNDELEDRVQRRTAQLEETNEELIAARDEARGLTQAKDAFLATVSHELRNPLNQVTGFCQLLEMTELDEEQRADLKKILTASSHLLTLINDILDYQKIIMGGLSLEPAEFDVKELLGEVQDAMAFHARGNKNQLMFESSDEVGALYADKQRVRQVLINLVGNACKFTKAGTVTVTAVRRTDGEHQWVELSVRDTGRGMKPEELAGLFTPFSKLAARDGNQAGTGLGLVISKGLCELMGGDIGVTSQFGAGTTFTVRLPATPSDRLPKAAPLGPEDERAEDPKSLAADLDVVEGREELVRAVEDAVKEDTSAVVSCDRTVLVIDDDDGAREMTSRFLSDQGFHVVTAADGLEGLRLAKKIRPAVITLDALMPGLDGWAVLAALKTDSETRSIPVVMVTITESDFRSKALGAEEFLQKPVDWDDLSHRLSQYTGDKRERTVLVVDDDPSAREIIRRGLERDNWTVLEAEHGAAALELLAHEHPAAIILDLEMPVMNGFEFISHYSQLAEWLSVPVIVLTATDPTPEQRELLSGQVVRVLRKGDYSPQELLREIHRRVDRHIQEQETAGVGQ